MLDLLAIALFQAAAGEPAAAVEQTQPAAVEQTQETQQADPLDDEAWEEEENARPRLICRTVRSTGSRLRQELVCRTEVYTRPRDRQLNEFESVAGATGGEFEAPRQGVDH